MAARGSQFKPWTQDFKLKIKETRVRKLVKKLSNSQRWLIQQFQQYVALLFDLSANLKVLSHVRKKKKKKTLEFLSP